MKMKLNNIEKMFKTSITNEMFRELKKKIISNKGTHLPWERGRRGGGDC